MKQRFYLFLLILSALFISSCQKEDGFTDPDPTDPVCRVDSIFLEEYGAKLMYENDLVTGFQSDEGVSLSITYNSNKKATSATYSTAGVWVMKKQWSYNSAGAIAEEIYEFNLYGTGDGQKSKYVITYNNGKRAESAAYYFDPSELDYVYGGKMIYYWASDNLVSTDHYDDSDTKVMTTTYTYDLTRLNNLYDASTLSQLLMGPSDGTNLQDAFLLSKNILTRATESAYDRRDYAFEYTYINDELIHTITAKDMMLGGVEDGVQKFFYKCN